MINSVVNVLVVDDSEVARALLVHVLEADPCIRVIGAVPGGEPALKFLEEARPDVVLMDIHMPGMDGFEATRRIMETHPVPIVICSGVSNPKEVATTFRLLEAGAVACVAKPVGPSHPEYNEMSGKLRETLRLMSEVKVVRRWARPGQASAAPASNLAGSSPLRFIGIGASTGGPPVLQTILGGLPKGFSVPILIVQHIAPGFLPGLAEWLRQTTGFQIHIGSHGSIPLPGHVYLAPDDFHLGVSATGRLKLSREPAAHGLRPSVSCLFRSLAEMGAAAAGVLLTGMGKDGSAELKLMREAGAVTIAQSRESSVVHGMPGEAIALGGALHVLPPEEIADMLAILALQRR